MLATLLFAFAAGSLSILSPCVLPLIPVVLGSAAARGPLGPWLLALGLVLSFVAVGMFVSLIGFSIGLDGKFFRSISAVMLLAIGLLLAVPYLQRQFAAASGPMANWMDSRFGSEAAGGQFGIGLLLGAVWSPCVGPTLGAASLLAAQGQNIGEVSLTMASFGFGVAASLIILGLLSREVLLRWRGRILSSGVMMKSALGAFFIVTGVLILSDQDKLLEAALVEISPVWLTALTTHF